nr:iron-containing alcohol dehydrogenase family protein [Rubidibacter lacunae]
MRGSGVIARVGTALAQLGQRPILVGGDRTLAAASPFLQPVLEAQQLTARSATYCPDSSERTLASLQAVAADHRADFVIGIGGGKALDAAKLLGDRAHVPVATVPTSAATCAAWTALSNIYTDEGAYLFDIPLTRCPELLVLDYDLIQTAPQRTLLAGIGDALAKWYEAAASSGDSPAALTIAAVQQARVLRDILFQKSAAAIDAPGSQEWCEVVDATVLLPGMIGGLGGANCRTVAAHAIHNGLTHLPAAHRALHGEKVALGILAQLRLEELARGNQLAASARQQLLQFFARIGLPRTLDDLGLGQVPLNELRRAIEVACAPQSDIHRLPFPVQPEQVLAALVSTTLPVDTASRATLPPSD